MKLGRIGPRVLTSFLIGGAVVMLGIATWRDAQQPPTTSVRPIGMSGASRTTRGELAAAAAAFDARLAANPSDAGAAIALADVLMRQARVVGDARLPVRAERALGSVLAQHAGDYEAVRMLASVYLAQHRFADAVKAAERARDMRPDDAWNYGAAGDGYLELGDYDRAFAAFDKMNTLRPNAAAYARVAYAHELQGRPAEALRIMQMAAQATSPHDPESQAWHFSQIGNLYFQLGQLDAAKREFRRADAVFPGHPYGLYGMMRVTGAEGDYRGALMLCETEISRAATPELAALAGDLTRLMGDPAASNRYYEMAEQLERDGWTTEEPQPGALARFLAERDRKLNEAVALAREAVAARRDIYSYDALAWAQFKTGDIAGALRSIEEALRTRTADRKILYHAAAIKAAAGDRAAARALVRRALDGNNRFDLIAAPAARALAASLAGSEPSFGGDHQSTRR